MISTNYLHQKNQIVFKSKNINPILKKTTFQNNNSSYNKIMKKFDYNKMSKEEVGAFLSKRSASLPESVALLLTAVGGYLEYNYSREYFEKQVKSRFEGFNDRVQNGEEKEVFQESYAPEIKLINSIESNYNSFERQDIDKNLFDNLLVDLTKKYLNTPVKRTKFFLK